MMKRFTICMTILLVGSWMSAATAQNSEMETAAVKAAMAWLSLTDAGNYEESWTEAAVYFKNAVTPEQWRQAMNAARKPLGGVLSREVTNATYQTSLPGAPDGSYVVVQFQTAFENKQSAVETVTPMLDEDGAWHVAGYFIK